MCKIFSCSSVIIFLFFIETIVCMSVEDDSYNYQKSRTKSIENIAKKVSNLVNKDINPCDDILKYICPADGKVNKDDSILQRPLEYPGIDELIERIDENDPKISQAEIKLKNYAASCKNRNLREQIENLNIAKTLGGWPAFNPDWKDDDFNWARAVAEFNKAQIDVLLTAFYSRMENENAGTFILTIISEVERPAEEIAKDLKEYGVDAKTADDIAPKISQLLTDISNQYDPEIESPENLFDFDKLQQEVTNFDVKEYFETYFERPSHSLPPIKIHIDSKKHFNNFVNLIQNTDKKTLANYFMWKTIKEFHIFMNPCRIQSSTFSRPIITKILIRQKHSEDDDNLAYEVLNGLKSSLESMKDRFDFKSYKDQMAVLKGWMKIVRNQNELIDDEYQDVEISPKYFFQNLVNTRQKLTRKSIKINDDKMYYQQQRENVTDISLINELLNDFFVLRGYPAAVYFAETSHNFWLDIGYESSPYTPEEFNETVDCLTKAGIQNLSDYKDLKHDLLFIEMFRQSYKNFQNWMDRDEITSVIENEILSDYGLSNEKLFVLTLTQYMCHKIDQDDAPQRQLANNKIVADAFNCPKKPYMKCKLNKH